MRVPELESGGISSFRQADYNAGIRIALAMVGFEGSSDPTCRRAYDGIVRRIKLRVSTESLRRNGVGFNPVTASGNNFVDDKLEKGSDSGGRCELS